MANSILLGNKQTVLHLTHDLEVVASEWKKDDLAPLTKSLLAGQSSIIIQEGHFEIQLDLGIRTDVLRLTKGQSMNIPAGAAASLKCESTNGQTLHINTGKSANQDEDTDKNINRDFGPRKFSTPTLSDLKEKLSLGLSSEPSNWRDLENSLHEISEHSVSTASPYFMNQLFSGVLPETLASEAVINRFRTTLATFEASPTFTAVEIEVIDQLGELVGWKNQERDGVGLPGGSAANFMAIHCARHLKSPLFRTRGPQGEKFKIFVSELAHYSLSKACLATGLGTDALVSVAVDEQGRMSAKDLKRDIEISKSRGETPLLVCATAGTTVAGAFDPIDQIAELCEELSLWLHVDAAWGGPALFSSKARILMKGVHRADSVTFDAHKLLGSRLTSSFFLTRHRDLLNQANDGGGEDYLFHSTTTELDRGRSSWQCGRGADALSLWALWKLHGTKGLGNFVDRLLAVRDESVEWIKSEPRLALVFEPTYLNICVRLKNSSGSVDKNSAIKAREAMKAEDFSFVNFSEDSEGSFLRLILAHPKIDIHVIKAILTRALEITK